MAFKFGENDFKKLRQLLARQSFLRTPDRQLDFVTGVFLASADAKILDQLQTRNDGTSYAIHILEFLGNYDSGRVTRTFIEGVLERLGEGEDAEWLGALLQRYFPQVQPGSASTQPQPVASPPQTALMSIDATPFMAEMAQLRTDLARLQATDQADVIQLLQVVALQQNGQQAILEDLAELRNWAATTLQGLQAVHTQQGELREQLSALATHSATSSQYFMASIPIIPGLLTYNVELGSGHTADLKAIWGKLKARLGGAKAVEPVGAKSARPSPKRPGRASAILVGVNVYEKDSGISSLNYSARDATAVKQVLAQAGYDTQLFADRQANSPLRNEILKALVGQAGNASKDDLLLFYFSGHGTTEAGEGYLLPRNTEPGIMIDTALKISRVLEIMNHSPAKAKVLVLDACHSGAQIGKAGAEMSPEFIEQVYRQAKGVAVLASCAQHQLSWEDFALQHSVFTSAVLEGLSGLADFEVKGFVSVQDLNRYVRDRVAVWGRANGKVQTPTLKYDGSGDIVLLDLPAGA